MDFKKALRLLDFRKNMLNDNSMLIPILITATNGGTDQNPRYPNTRDVAADRFKEYDFDVDILYPNAAGYSAYSAWSIGWFLRKVAIATILLPYFVSLEESICETRKNVFYFRSKALFLLEKIS